MTGSGNTGIKRLRKALRFSWQGLKACYKHEEAFRQEVWLLVVAVPLAFWWGESGLETAVMVSSVLLLMIIELVNSALEAIVDRIGPDRHELSGRAKDMGSAAVLLGVVNVVVVWALLLI